jgi:RNA polymerase sigma-70 factor, ECF subfamily
MKMTVDSAKFAVTAAASDDLDLVHASKNGDVAAFEQLVKRYDRKLLRIAQSVTHNREDSQDAVQEAFLKAYTHLATFREDSKFSTWLFRITVNQSLMKLRKQRTTREASLDEDFQADGDVLPKEVTDWAPNPEQLYWASELRDILIKCLEELSPILRMVFVLRDIEGLTIDQTVEVLNVSETAVKARLWRARLQLRESLNEYFSEQAESARAESSSCKTLTDRTSERLNGYRSGLRQNLPKQVAEAFTYQIRLADNRQTSRRYCLTMPTCRHRTRRTGIAK